MAALAEQLGMKAASSYQRYEHPSNYERKEYLPFDMAVRIGVALDGKGEPSVHRSEIIALAGIDRALPVELEPAESVMNSLEILELVRLYSQLEHSADRKKALELLRSMVGE